MRAKTFAMKMHFMMKNFFSGALWKEYVDGMAYAHNIKRVEKKLNYESDENACLHEKQNLDMLRVLLVHKEMSGNIKKFFIKSVSYWM